MGPLARRFRVAGVVVAIALGACIEPQLVPCGDQLCPRGATCVAGAVCASAEQIAACADIDEGGTCSVGGGVGRCDSGVCVATGCGNAVIDLNERCDDGNAISGDGCRGDCQKVELCGDEVVDTNERCDDGNANPADGCDTCMMTSWSAVAVIGGDANALSVGLASPSGIAIDRHRNLYVADTENHRIRRVDQTGVVTTVAGGMYGSDGDGGAATNAELASPLGVAVDGLGNVYIADTDNHRIRRVDTTGVITTVVGTGAPGATGDGGSAIAARLFRPAGIAVDGLGNLFIADTYNQRIRRVDPAGIITTLAGTGVIGFSGDGGAAIIAQLSSPAGVAVDYLGDVYVADTNNHRIRRITATGIISTVAGSASSGSNGDGGAATSAQLAFPRGVAIDRLGNHYIADEVNHRIRRVAANGTITTIAGTTSGFSGDGEAAVGAQLFAPSGVATDGMGNVYIADTANHRLRRVDGAGIIATAAGTGTRGFSGDGGAATSARLLGPSGIASGGGNLYVADRFGHRIRRIDASGVITTIAGSGTAGWSGDGGPATSARLSDPAGIELDGLGNLYVADAGNHRIRRIDASGIITTVAGSGMPGSSGDGGIATNARLTLPAGIAIDGGTLYIADTNNHRVRRVDASGVITTMVGTGVAGAGGDGGPSFAAQLSSPGDVAIDGGVLYIADTHNHRIRRVDAGGIITTIAGLGTPGFSGDGGAATGAQLNYPSGLARDSSGNLYIADTNNHRVRRVDAAAGLITTVAGTQNRGFTGDGGSASSAALNNPACVAVEGGNVYVGEIDSANHRVRRIAATGIITTIAGGVDPEGMGPLAQARLANPRALVLARFPSGGLTFVAGGTSGIVAAAREATAWLEVVAGRYPHQNPTGMLARFSRSGFGTIAGIAYDAASSLLYLTESSSNRIHIVTVVDPEDANTWTIAPLANAAGTAEFADGPAQVARFREPTGLYFDATARQLYVADTGNHIVRAIDLSSGAAAAMVRTVAGIPMTRGYFGDGDLATTALLHAPQAITRCANGDLFVADTGNHRVRRVAMTDGEISTVLGDGVAASSGEGGPANAFPVNTPLGLACDAFGNLFVTSTTTVRLVSAAPDGIVDGTGAVQTIYGAPPRDSFPASVTTCLTGVAVVDGTAVQVVDSCSGLLVELRRTVN